MPLIRYRLSIIPMAGSKYCQINFCYYITNSQATPAPSPASVKQHSRHITIIMWAIVPRTRHCCWPPWSMQPLCFVNYLKYVQFFSPFGFLRRQLLQAWCVNISSLSGGRGSGLTRSVLAAGTLISFLQSDGNRKWKMENLSFLELWKQKLISYYCEEVQQPSAALQLLWKVARPRAREGFHFRDCLEVCQEMRELVKWK